jgi:hypothetical protein
MLLAEDLEIGRRIDVMESGWIKITRRTYRQDRERRKEGNVLTSRLPYPMLHMYRQNQIAVLDSASGTNTPDGNCLSPCSSKGI